MTRDLQARVSETDWECLSADTRYLSHGIHRYSSKFIPQVARNAIELTSEPGQLVVDPYCGSGTTLLEAALLDRRAIGIDLSPLAVLISRVKTTPIGAARIQRAQHDLMSSIESRLGLPTLWAGSSGGGSQVLHRDRWFEKWFKPRALDELDAIYVAVEECPDDRVRDVARVAFSDILRKASNAHQGYPNVMFDRNRGAPPSPLSLFARRFSEVGEAVTSLVGPMSARPIPEVRLGDARDTGIKSGSIDAVVTHPPYIGSVPYAEYGVLSLKWFGHDPADLDDRLTGGRRLSKTVVERFEDGFAGMIGEAHRILKKGRLLFMLVGDPLVRGERIDLGQMAERLAADTGFSLAAKHLRSGTNRRANKMAHETALFFRKS